MPVGALSHQDLGRVLSEAVKENVSLKSPCDIDLSVPEGDEQDETDGEIFCSTTSNRYGSGADAPRLYLAARSKKI